MLYGVAEDEVEGVIGEVKTMAIADLICDVARMLDLSSPVPSHLHATITGVNTYYLSWLQLASFPV
jgi:hypothetical protein